MSPDIPDHIRSQYPKLQKISEYSIEQYDYTSPSEAKYFSYHGSNGYVELQFFNEQFEEIKRISKSPGDMS